MGNFSEAVQSQIKLDCRIFCITALGTIFAGSIMNFALHMHEFLNLNLRIQGVFMLHT